MSLNSNLNYLNTTTDALVWAEAFINLIDPDGNNLIDIDTDLMLAWFANAIETGRSAGLSQGYVASETIREIAYQCAGVGSAAVMEKAPDVVMPEDKIIPGVERVLKELWPNATKEYTDD